MESAAKDVDPVAAGDQHEGGQMVLVARDRLQELEMRARRGELDARNVELLQGQVKALEGALEYERARSDKQAETLADLARACDRRVGDQAAQYKDKVDKLETLVADKDATIAEQRRMLAAMAASQSAIAAEMKKQTLELESRYDAIAAAQAFHSTLLQEQQATMEASNAAAVAARAEAAAQLSAVHAAVTSNLALELHPVRHDRRQFATLHVGPVPFDEFDLEWCAAACGETWEVDIDPVTRMRAHVTKRHAPAGCVTLRGAAPLPLRLHSTAQLPSYRVVIEAYPMPDDDGDQTCNLGFMPSHTCVDGAPVTPVMGRRIRHYGGWWFQVNRAIAVRVDAGATVHGWTPLRPRLAAGAGAGGDVEEEGDSSAYATTDVVPVVPVGSAVELAVDYAAGTCRVAFYTPAAVVGDFVEAPYAKMELRFVATDAADVPDGWGSIPARSVPTAAAVDSSVVQLYPAVSAANAGAVLRFV